ncbi:hypothetical protein DPMN_092680 [Dreissena polymorpha]|uniref:Uncharacterized protein n=1 Tax=Dreissena polymorpha TaxID=45954 RepID=A0A9D4L455_DREPO|nr:hypothetical protein DPMN_092680 [Dreissena polymorpha]
MGNGPTKSIARTSHGAPARRWPRGAFGFLVGFRSASQISQALTYVRTDDESTGRLKFHRKEVSFHLAMNLMPSRIPYGPH